MKTKLHSSFVLRPSPFAALLASLAVWLAAPPASAQTGPGYALSFNGTNAYVSVATTYTVPYGTDPYTIEAWIRPNSMGNYGIIGWGEYGTTNAMNSLSLLTNGLINSWWGNDLTYTNTGLAGAWHHVAVACNGTTWRIIYLDGALVRSNSFAGTHTVPLPTSLSIGRVGSSNYFDGAIDEVRVWNQARTQVQIQTNRFTQLEGNETGLKAYWRFDAGSGPTAEDSAAGGVSDGTLSNGPSWIRSGATNVPQCVTSNATSITTASAQLNANVHPGNLAAKAWFQWGTTGNYGTNTPQITVGPALPSDTNALAHEISSVLTNLAVNTTYYYRVAVTNTVGTNYGAQGSFTTEPLPTGSGCALSFDGTNDYVFFGAAPVTSPWTAEFWVNRQDSPDGSAVLLNDSVTSLKLEQSGTARHVGFTRYGVNDYSFNYIAPTNTWVHLAFVSDTTTRLYVNGVLQDTLSQIIPLPLNYLGWIGDRLKATLDEIRIWNVARSEAQIQANLYRPLAGNESGLLAYWKLDECSGTLAADATGHGYDGTLTNNPTWTTSTVNYGPGITTLPATNLTTTSAMLKGSTHPQGFATTAWFQWGATTNYGFATAVTNAGSGILTVALSTNITSLASNQTYHFRAVGSNSYGVSYGGDQSFWLGTPLVTTLPASDLTTNAATVNGSVIPSGPSAQAWFQYGLTTNYDNATVPTPLVSGTLPVAVTNRLQPLLSGKTYHYRIVATNSFGVALGSDLTFTGPVLGENIVAGLTGVAGSSVAWGDYDNDGDLDILLTGVSSSSGIISRIYRNNGNGTFTDLGAGLPGLYFSSVAWGDYDNDGDLDTLLTGTTNGDTSGTISKIYRNNGAGPFTDIKASLPGVHYSSVAWGDYDNDGNLDILLTGLTADPTIFLADFDTGNNGFTYVPDTDATSNLWHRSAHKFASPGNCQYFGLEGSWNYNTGARNAGNLQSPPISLAGSVAPITLSFNYWLQTEGGTTWDQATVLISTNGGVSWTTIVTPLGQAASFINQVVDLSAYAGSTIVLRFNFDTLDAGANTYEGWYVDDVTIKKAPTTGPISRVYHNNGDGTFTDSNASLPGVDNSSVAWGDYDKDGDLDILLTGQTDGGGISRIYRNNGNSTFTDLNAGLPGVSYGSVAWGDYDNDGDLDILLTGQTASGVISRIYRNNGNSTFTDIIAGLPGTYLSSAAWGDYDNDGYLDILLTGTTNGDTSGAISKIYRNNGTGTFTEVTTTSLPGDWYSSVAWGDYNNDGRLDLLLTGWAPAEGYVSHLYHNYWPVTNTIPAAPRNLTANVVGTNAVLSWSVGSDLQTPALGLSYNLRVGTTPGGSNVVSPQAAATGFRRVPQLGNMQQSLAATLTGLKYGSNYYWSVQAVDTAFAGSPFVNAGSFAVTFAPSAAAVQVGSVMGTSAVLGATIHPNGSPTTAYFQWGATANYGNSSAPAFAGSGMSPVSLSKTLTGLQPGTLYHYRIVTSNANGTTYGPDQTFYVDATVAVGDVSGDGKVDQAELDAVLANYWLNSPWLYMTNPATLGGGYFQFALTNANNWDFSVIVSTNNVDWTDLSGRAYPVYQFLDPEATNYPARFYRLRWP